MKCNNCSKYIPKSIKMCPHCGMWHKLENDEFPSHDKYGYPTNLIYIDDNKSNAREVYLRDMVKRELHMPTYHEQPKLIHRTPKKNDDTASLVLIYGPMIGAMLGMALFTYLSLNALLGAFCGVIGYFLVFMTIATAIDKRKRKKELASYSAIKTVDNTIDKEYLTMKAYYESPNVIGFSSLDHTEFVEGCLEEFFQYYEIDRKNIAGISYDSKYACYIIHTIEPIYWNYSSPPVNKVYLADIFDDNTLTKALQLNLPPKQINF